MDVSPDELPSLYSWVDGIPLSRPKKNIARDFSDGVLAAEVVAHYCPRLVDTHNYSGANGLAQKFYNWNTLNSFGCRYHPPRKSPPILSTPCRQSPHETSICMSPRKSLQDSITEKLPEKESPRDSQKDAQIRELRETIELLEAKVMKLEQLVRLKDHKIHVLGGKPTR